MDVIQFHFLMGIFKLIDCVESILSSCRPTSNTYKISYRDSLHTYTPRVQQCMNYLSVNYIILWLHILCRHIYLVTFTNRHTPQ